MDVTVSGRKMPVSDSLKAYAEDKIGGAVEQLDVGAISCDVVLYREKNPANPNPAIREVTVLMKGHVARVEESEQDMFAAIDVAAARSPASFASSRRACAASAPRRPSRTSPRATPQHAPKATSTSTPSWTSFPTTRWCAARRSSTPR